MDLIIKYLTAAHPWDRKMLTGLYKFLEQVKKERREW